MTAASRSFAARVIGAARLDGATYEEVARDPAATGQAVAVVLLTTAAAAVGSGSGVDPVGLAAVLLVGPTLWLVLALATGFAGTRLAPAPPATGFLAFLRALGFAETPGLLAVFGGVPAAGSAVAAVAAAWGFAAAVVAVRRTLGTSTGRAVAAVGLGLLLGIVAWVLLVAVIARAAEALF